LLASPFAQAAGIQYICSEKDALGSAHTVVLTQQGSRPLKEGEKQPFTLRMYETGEKTPSLVKQGTVETEDVMFSFKSDDKKLTFGIYLDELDQSYLEVNRKTTYFV
jgi:hypothetical protein